MEERWFDEELSGCRLGDDRLDRRLRQLVERMDAGFGETIPLACQDWASTKAAYRFFSNERVSEEEILRGHFDATRRRFAASDGPILVLHDTTEFTYKRSRSEAVGFTTKVSSGKDKRGRERMHTVCGLLMHSSLAATTDGLPLGMAAAKFWTRKKFKGTNALKRKINPTRVPIEGKESMRWLENLRQSTELLGDPARCVHICDREGDIWELFSLAELWELRPDGTNPCRHVKRFKEDKRERFLSDAEYRRLGSALREIEQEGSETAAAIAAIRLLMLTGCRLSEIQKLRWEYVDLDTGELRLPDTKTGAKLVHLGEPAIAVLRDIQRQDDNPWVIAGRKEGGHLTDLQHPWRRIRARAGLDDVRIHDLRHSFASGGLLVGEGLPMIGKLLGHTQVQTTARYAHLANDPVKSAANRIASRIAEVAG